MGSERTRQWWKKWGAEPLAQDFTSVEWEYMLDTARVHNAIWRDGEMKLMAELRLRVAKVGATVEDRQRLRIEYAPVVDSDGGGAPSGGARARRGPLKAV